MQNTTADKPISITDNPKQNIRKKLTISDIEKFYLKSAKSKKLYGLEYERLSLDINKKTAADYTSIKKIIEHFSKIMNWELVYDDDIVIGAVSPDNTSISLEPGCQLEISLSPKENISDIDINLSKITTLLDKIAKLYDVIFLGYGVNPSQTPDEIKILNKRRYKIMNNYLPNCKDAELCTSMMRKTAGIQVNIDYSSKKDAYLKLKFFNLISPFVSALCANSPFDNKRMTDIKSNRVNIWQFVGSQRCNLFYEDIFCHLFKKYDNIFKNYINCVLDVPMVYIERNNECIPINGLITFREFMKSGFLDYSAEIDDYILHQSLCFPDVRLKQYIEIRNHDSSNPDIALMLCALYKGLSRCNFEKLLKKFSYLKLDKIPQYYKTSLGDGLDLCVCSDISGWDVIKELFNISKQKLNTRERCYLEPLIKMLKLKQTSADSIIESGVKSPDELVEFLYF